MSEEKDHARIKVHEKMDAYNRQIERLNRDISNIESRKKKINNVFDNINNIIENEEVFFNNQLKGINDRIIYRSLGGRETMEYGEVRNIVDTYAGLGDPLCIKISEFLKNNQAGSLLLYNYHQKVLSKLVARTMTEEEYNKHMTANFELDTYS